MSVVFEGSLAIARCDVAGCASIRYIQAAQLTVTDSRHPEKLTVAVVRRMLMAHGWKRRRRKCGPLEYPKRMQQYRMLDLCPECAAKGTVK